MEPPATYLSVLQKNKAKQSKAKQRKTKKQNQGSWVFFRSRVSKSRKKQHHFNRFSFHRKKIRKLKN
jgi:kynurenine formamidase